MDEVGRNPLRKQKTSLSFIVWFPREVRNYASTYQYLLNFTARLQ